MTSDENSFWRLSPTATAVSGLLHAMVLLAIASQAVISELAPWQPRSDPKENVPAVELTIVRPEPKPPRPPTASLPNVPARIPISAPERPPPPPPLAPPGGANLASVLPLPEATPAVAPPIAPPKPAAQQAAPPAPAAKPQAQPYRSREDYLLQVIRTLARSPFIPRVRLETAPGVVVTQLTVSRDGRLLEAELTRSSGYSELDNAMMEAIRRAGPFPPPPAETGPNGVPASAGDRYTLTVPIRFRPLDSSRLH